MKVTFTAMVLLFLFSCALPQVHVIDDPLTAAQHNDLGYIYENQGKYELAEREYGRAAQMQKEWAAPYFNLGNVYFKKGDQRKAEKLYRQALEIDPNNPDIMNNLAYLLSEQGQFDEAERWIDRALSISTKEEYLQTQTRILSRKVTSPPSP